VPIPLRTDFDAKAVRAAAKRSKDGPQARRLLALAAIYEGATRTEAAKVGGVTLQIVRDWVLKFNTHGPQGLLDRKPPGQPPRLNDEHRAALAAIIESGPIPAVHGVVRWRIIDLCQWIYEEFRIVVAKQTLSRELRAMGYRKLSARPRHHAQAAGAIEDFKKSPPERLAQIGHEKGIEPTAIEVWFADEARIGQKNKITRRWAKRGTRPSAPKDQRTASAYILRRDLSQGRQGRGARHAPMRYRGDEPPSRRNRHPDRARRTRRDPPRSGGLASLGQTDRPAQHHADPIPGKVPRAEPAGGVAICVGISLRRSPAAYSYRIMQRGQRPDRQAFQRGLASRRPSALRSVPKPATPRRAWRPFQHSAGRFAS
jgi:transposase